MSNENKIRDLMARLAAMSPEPPPYPEDTHMAQHRHARRTRPVLVFVGAALLVVALAVPLLLFTGNGQPDVIATTTTTTLPETSTTASVITTTTVPRATTTTSGPTTTVPASTWTGIVYMFQTPTDSFLGNPALVPVTVRLTDPSGTLDANAEFTDALSMIGSGLPELVADARLVNGVPPGVRILERTTGEPGMQVVDMNEDFLLGAGGLLADFTMLNQLVYTITHGEADEAGVLFTVGGEPVTAFGSEGLDLSQPVYRDSFQDNLASIYLTEPVVQNEGEYRIAGLANVFEAMIAVQVVDGNGEIVHEEPVMATCGSGCWGSFDVALDPDLITAGESSVRLLTHSAQDGSEIEVVTVPIPEGDSWTITAGS